MEKAIDDTEDETAANGTAITASALASGGVMSPELVAIQPTPTVEIQPGQTSPGKRVETIQRPPGGIAPKGGIKGPIGDDSRPPLGVDLPEELRIGPGENAA